MQIALYCFYFKVESKTGKQPNNSSTTDRIMKEHGKERGRKEKKG